MGASATVATTSTSLPALSKHERAALYKKLQQHLATDVHHCIHVAVRVLPRLRDDPDSALEPQMKETLLRGALCKLRAMRNVELPLIA